MKNGVTILSLVLGAGLVFLLLGGGNMLGYGGFGMMGPGMMGGFGSPYGYRHNPITGVLSLAFWALIIVGGAVLVVWLVRQGGRPPSAEASVFDIIKARYAKGEISREQFDRMKQDLGAQTQIVDGGER